MPHHMQSVAERFSSSKRLASVLLLLNQCLNVICVFVQEVVILPRLIARCYYPRQNAVTTWSDYLLRSDIISSFFYKL